MVTIRTILSLCTMLLIAGVNVQAQEIEMRYLGVSGVTASYSNDQMMSVLLKSNSDDALDIEVDFTVHNQQNELLAQVRTEKIRLSANQAIVGPRFSGVIGNLSSVLTRPGFDRIIRPNFNFPTGNYKICAYVRNVESVVIARICYQVMVQPPFRLHLIYPFDGQSVEEEFPVFSWTPILQGFGQRVNYRIRWVESSGELSKHEFNDHPAFFVQEKLRTSYLPYSSAFENFDRSKTYLWKVQAFSDGKLVTESEVWEFNFENRRNSKKNNGPYVKLSKSAKNNVVYLRGDQLNVEIQNPYAKVDLTYTIVGLQQNTILSGVWSAGKESVSGKNYKSIKLGNKIIPGRPYRLQVRFADEILELFFVKK